MKFKNLVAVLAIMASSAVSANADYSKACDAVVKINSVGFGHEMMKDACMSGVDAAISGVDKTDFYMFISKASSRVERDLVIGGAPEKGASAYAGALISSAIDGFEYAEESK